MPFGIKEGIKKMRSTKLLTILLLSFLVPMIKVGAQCSLITKNGSSQDPKTVCAPVNFTMNVWFKFFIPVDTSLVEITFVWNDGTGATNTVPGIWNAAGDSIWAEASHIYPPTDECSRTADAYLVFDGDRCTSSGHQEQTFSTWGTDEENSGVLSTDPVVAYFCEGEDIVDVTFDDNSTFNCNIGIEPDNPNRYYRWVQFIYNTYVQSGDRIPSVTVRDDLGVVHNMTDNTGNFISSLDGPIIRIPIPADGPNQTSFAISAPAGGVAGDIFEITLRNWNVCNPYDNLPTDGIPPADLINGDNPPIITTARIEIIAPPPVVVSSLFEFCTSQTVHLTANAGTAQVRWYADSMLTTLLYVGNNYYPQNPPFNLNNTIPGSYTFWVTSFEGICESAPSRVNVVIYQQPEAVNAGPDQTICADSVLLSATPPSAGTGQWTTTGPATFDNSSNPITWARGLSFGLNNFTWTVTNGICQASDQVRITSDRKPSPALAGPDDSLCFAGSITLSATPPDLNGRGHWLILEGGGMVSDTSLSNADYLNATLGNNRLLWRVSSQYGACPVTKDTVLYFVDLSPGIAEAGPNVQFCETDQYDMVANAPVNGGTGAWTVLSGSPLLSNYSDSHTQVNSLHAGINRYRWKLTSRYGLCPSSDDSVTIIRDLSPGIANAGPDISLCLENSDTLQANSPAFGNGEWQVISNPSGVNPVFNPNQFVPNAIITVLPGNEGEYILQWTMQNGSCVSRDTMNIDFGIPPPPGFAGIDSSICGLKTWLQSNTFPQGQGIWNQLTGPSTAVFVPNRLSDNPEVSIPAGGEGIYNFEWMLTSGACAPSSDTVQITFLGVPDNPIVTGNESCGPDSLELTAAISENNVIVEWYNTPVALTPFYTGESYVTPYLLVSRNYYVESYDTVTGCRGPRITIPATIYQIPAVPVLQGDTLCGPGNANANGTISSPANTIRWYADAGGNILLHEGLAYSFTATGDVNLWARAVDTVHGCVSALVQTYVIVYPLVPVPTALNDSSCGSAEFILYSTTAISGDLIYWYDASVGGTLLRIADSLYLPFADSTRIVWIAEVNPTTGCSSTRIPVEAIIHPIPGIPVIADISSCGPGSFTLRPVGDSNNTTFRWYNQPVGGTLLQISDTLFTGLLSSNKSYWVSGYNEETSCESPREQLDISIFPMPAPIAIIGPTLVLLNQSGIIFSTTGSSTSTYVWTVPSGVTLDQNMNDFIRLSFPNTGSYTLTVYEITSHGCIGIPVSHPITVINDSIAVDIGLYNQKACTNVDFDIRPYLFGGTPPYTYLWTGDIAYLSNPSSLFTTFSPPGTGTYHLFLEVADVNLKRAYDSVAITVYASPTAYITTRDEIVCVGDNLQLRVETTGYNAVNHLWSGPIQNLDSYTIKEPIYTPLQPDTVLYHYQLTDINGCKAYDSTYIYSDIPLAYFELLTGPGCSPLQAEFNNLSERGVAFAWDFGDGTYSTLETPAHTYLNQTPEIKYYPVKLEVTSILGCKDDITQYAMVWPNPQATIDAIPDHGCSPASITLFSTPGNFRYYWDYGSGENEVTNAFSTTHIFEAPGENDKIYTVSVITESSLHCIDSAFLNLNIYATPEADFTINPTRDTFPDNTFQLQNSTSGERWNYLWDFGDGRTSSLKQPGSIAYNAPGNYEVTLTASSNHCSDTISKKAYLYPALPEAKFTPPEPGCMPHTINFVNTSEYADEYLWDFGDGSISTAANPSYTYYEAGIYRVNLTVIGPGGESSHSDTARVFIIPNAFFDLAPRYVYVNDESVHFFNLSDHADGFEWDFGDGEKSTDQNPEHVYKNEGTFDITLTVWTENNCYDLFIMENAVFVEPSGVIEYPNVFRPNSPLEENRVFLPGVIDHVDEYHLMIFNRWGELIFESRNQEAGWDGFFQGKPAKQDVYIWKVTGTYTDGKGFTKTGDVTLMY
jgi:gliding motility-associated-like protein